MSDFVFSFLEDQFRDIYLDCARMDKNLIEGDGVESILIAGRIAEKITKAIYAMEGIKEREDNQYKRIENLSNANILPKNIKRDLSELRRLRNNVYHNSLSSDGAGGFNPSKSYVQSGGLRDYKTGFNEVKDYSKVSNEASANSKNNSNYPKKNLDIGGELTAAREAHKLVFNICVWFYVNYSGDKDFIRPKYKISRRTQEADFLLRLKSAINEGNDFISLRQRNPNNEIIQILNELYVKKVTDDDTEEQVYGLNKEVKIRKPGVPYSQCLGISYDDELFMWRAVHGNKDLGLFESSKEAYEAREIYISSVPMPKKVQGHYSKARGISFSKIQKLWSVSVKGQIISYHPSEDDAIKARKKYLKAHGLVDVKVKGGFKTITIEEKERLQEKARLKKEKKKEEIKTISSNSSLKNELKKDEFKRINEDFKYSKSTSTSESQSGKSSRPKSDKSNDNLSYYDVFNKEENDKKNKVKVVNGSKVQKTKPTKKVKVSGGNRVSKRHKSKSSSKSVSNTSKKTKSSSSKSVSNVSNKSKKSKKSKSAINKKKSSKYEGVFYEEGLFMWSAEVDGKHLGLFSSEKEAYEKREEYIKNKSN